MAHNILITGASGYLGGTLLARWEEADLTGYDKLFALVRKPEQADGVKQYGAEPLIFDADDAEAVREAVTSHKITIVYFLIDAFKSDKQVNFIRALSEVKKSTGKDVHFLHTTGAKMFSSLTGAPTDKPLLDSDPDIFEIHKAQRPPSNMGIMQIPIQTNVTVVEEGEKHGVKTYVFAPCIVYGRGEGFGNVISIQTVDVVTSAKALGQVYRLRDDRPTWPVCHIQDNTALYIALLSAILDGGSPGHGRNGFYLASSGSVIWDDLYDAMARSLAKKGIVKEPTVKLANSGDKDKIASALGVPVERVEFNFSGKCTYTAARGKDLGWSPKYPPKHILEDAENEVDLILQNANTR
ncbi:Hypothetical protein D9617_2g054440 [Elsinoe fawcettii]|nr:Hypothetical protein D9617_2g054440 [Elsinoe fawcettii]